jgi:hypothetical protein
LNIRLPKPSWESNDPDERKESAMENRSDMQTVSSDSQSTPWINTQLAVHVQLIFGIAVQRPIHARETGRCCEVVISVTYRAHERRKEERYQNIVIHYFRFFL